MSVQSDYAAVLAAAQALDTNSSTSALLADFFAALQTLRTAEAALWKSACAAWVAAKGHTPQQPAPTVCDVIARRADGRTPVNMTTAAAYVPLVWGRYQNGV